MPKITVLPHSHYCPDGVELEAKVGESILQVLLRSGIAIEHACDMQCACTTCHIYIRQGFALLNDVSEQEDELLDKAWGVDIDSRLSCQAKMTHQDIVIEIPKYTLNQVAENK